MIHISSGNSHWLLLLRPVNWHVNKVYIKNYVHNSCIFEFCCSLVLINFIHIPHGHLIDHGETYDSPRASEDTMKNMGKYRKTSNISRTLVGNKIVDNCNIVGASPVGAAPTTSSFST